MFHSLENLLNINLISQINKFNISNRKRKRKINNEETSKRQKFKITFQI